MHVPTFVVGTGRCGSTMLSNMLREHPQILSLSEFFIFVSDLQNRLADIFPGDPIDGRQFWEIVAALPPRVNFALRHGFATQSIYPGGSPQARFSSQTGVPAILHTTLPHLTDDHDALFALLQDEVTAWPAAPVGEHYQRLFGWLVRHFGKRAWVERSGGSYLIAEKLLAALPESRLVHLVRDGRDAALSMQEHPGFRFALAMGSLQHALGVDPLESSDRTHLQRVPAELLPLLPERFDADALRSFHVPLALCGGLWSQQIGNGIRVLSTVPSRRLLTLRYEDFLTEPKRQLDTLAAFLGEEFIDEDWSSRCAATVRTPRSSRRDLPVDEARALSEACRPGFGLLRGAGVDYGI